LIIARLLIAVLLLALAVGAWVRVGREWRRERPLRQHLHAAMAYAQQGMGPQVEAELKEAVRLDPNCGDAYQLLAEYYLSARSWSRARTALERLAALQPKTEHLQCRLAACSLNMGDEVSAFHQAEAEIKRDPNCVPALATAALLLNGMGDKPRALTYLRRAARLEPDDPALQYLFAESLSDSFAYREARPVLEHILQLDPNHADAYAQLGIGWIDDASAPDHLQRAETALRKSLSLNPLNADARLALGKLLVRQGKPREAIGQLDEAGRLMPNSTRPPYEMAKAYDLAGQPQQAAAMRARFLALRQLSTRVSMLEKRAAVNPTVFDYPFQLGQIELRRGDYPRATIWLRKAQALRSGDRQVAAALQQLSRLTAGPARMAAVQERVIHGSARQGSAASGAEASGAARSIPNSQLPASNPR
jgi:tetratricopeptide (TPR) repeat protein